MSSAVAVRTAGAAADAVSRHLPTLVGDRVASRLAEQDPTLWGPAVAADAAVRLSWVDLARSSRPLLTEVAALRDRLRGLGLDHVVLCGMGGSSLAPEVISRTAGVELTVLDSTDPDQVRAALADRLDRTVVVVSSKSGTTAETDAGRRAYEQAFAAAGLDPRERIVVVTDPGSALEELALAAGYVVVRADPHVGGRYSALSAFGLVPSGLAGADLARLLDEAEAARPALVRDDPANPALLLGAALGGTAPLRHFVVLVEDPASGQRLAGFADWAEQLLAESTGKAGTGLLPVVVEDGHAPDAVGPCPDALVVELGPAESGQQPFGEPASGLRVTGPLGAQLLLWELATAVAARLLRINPFDQPDVESAKVAARGLLDDRPETPAPAFVEAGIEVRASAGLLDGVHDLPGAVDALLGRLGPSGYLAVMAYLDRHSDAALTDVRAALARRTRRPVTFGWGPRFLHSTGQFHKGGLATGVFLQITGAPAADLPVPDRPFTFGELIAAQAQGDAQVLAARGRPVLRLHLTDRAAGIARLCEVLA
ncbi:MAG TPA: glucose-6-phosphate isomerase [Actinomycetes bacterium]|nr:glucose-6-phosphate isomerase [Actinomycetes bacterium]